MSRRHKVNDIENKSSNNISKAIKGNSLSILKAILGYSGRNIHKTITEVYNSCSEYWTTIFGTFSERAYALIVKKHEENMRNTLAMMDIEIKQYKPQNIVEDSNQKKIDNILNIDKIKEDDKPKRGRPIVKQLCEKISDSNIVKMARKCYLNIYRKALKFAQNITQYLVCFLYSLFDIPDNDTETVYGKVGHFHRIMSSVKGLKIPSVRRLQQMLKWFMEWRAAVIKTAKEIKEENIHRAWEELVEKIKRQFEILIPQYAMC